MNKKVLISLCVGTVVSGATLYLAFRNVPFQDLINYLASINYFWIIPSVVLVIVSFSLRALRWQFILGATHRVGFWRAFHPLMIGFMINCVLPGRLGEFARPLILNRKIDIPVATGLATVIVERVFDLIMLLSLFVIVSASTQIDPSIAIGFGKYTLNHETLETVFNGMLQVSVVLVIGIVLISLQKTRNFLNGVIMRFPNYMFFLSSTAKTRVREKLGRPVVGMINNVATGMTLIKNPKRISICFILSVCIWTLAAVSYYVFAIGCPQVRLTLTEMTAVMVILCFVIALPSVPGFWGLWEAGGVFAMMLFGIAEKDAAGFTLVNHAVQMFPVIWVGLMSAWISGVNIMQISYATKSQPG